MSTLAHDVTQHIAKNWESYYVSAVLSGIVGDAAHQAKGGYHISIEDQSSSNYSVTRPDDKAPPGTWPRNLAAGIDMSMSPTDMKLCSDRLWGVWYDQNDPRRNYLNGFNGWFNDGGPAKRYDYVSQQISETTDDHKWHVHAEERRKWVTDMNAANAILSILRGETKEQYLNNINTMGEEDMYAKYGMGLNGSPISHSTMYLQEGLIGLIDPNDPRLTDKTHPAYHPLTADGKFGDNTAYWCSIHLMGGDGREVNGMWFRRLDRMLSALDGNKQVADHLANTNHGNVELPDSVELTVPAQTYTIPAQTITADLA
jgi:hypothetical protein